MGTGFFSLEVAGLTGTTVHRFPLGTVTIGRGKLNDVVLAAPSVAHRHARFEVVDGRLCILDFGTTNGTRMRGELLPKRPRALASGDELRIDPFTLRVLLDPG